MSTTSGLTPFVKPTRLVVSKDTNERKLTKGQIKRMIASQIDGVLEHKYFSTTISSTTSNAITLSDLTLVPQGDTGTTRDGTAICVEKLDLWIVTTVGDVTNIVRYVLFYWHPDSTNEVPAVGDIMTANATYSTILPLKPSKFTIVWDEMVCVCTAEAIRSVHKSINLKKKKIMLIPGLNTGPNHLYLMAFSDSVAATHPGYQMYATLVFTDA